jgi:hypothetical protein
LKSHRKGAKFAKGKLIKTSRPLRLCGERIGFPTCLE